MLLLTLVQPAIGAAASSAAEFVAQAEEAGKVAAAAAETPDYTCSETKPCALGCCGPL
jgi:chitinase